LEDVKGKIHKKSNNKCVKFNPVVTKCDYNKKIIGFE
jgi:hypothetical protein